MNYAPLDIGWVPYGFGEYGGRLLVDWCNLADCPLEEPFFDQTIRRVLQQNPRASRSTPVETLAELTSKQTERSSTGFVFHISRCGSTLITQMLASVRQLNVFSEPAILETLLLGTYKLGAVSNEEKRGLLKNVFQAFSGYRADCRGTFFKFSARAIHDYPLIKLAHPDVPCIFVYRDPLEVVVSLAGNQADRLPPGLGHASLLNSDPETITTMRPAEFWARVVANQCAAALEMYDCSQTLLVNYSQLPEAVWTDIVSFFGVQLSVGDLERMRDVLTRSAKDPHKPFIDDRADKDAAATEEIRSLVDHFVRPNYDRLESIRVANRTLSAGNST